MKNNPLIQFGPVPVLTHELESCFTLLVSPSKKVQALEKSGEIVRLKRGMYIVNSELTGIPVNRPL